jgi:Mycobacterium membrane protein
MTDPRRPELISPPQAGSGASDPQDQPYVDPAYAEQAPYAQVYRGPPTQATANPNEPNPTLELPAYWREEQALAEGLPREGLASPPPEGPRSPRWLWFIAGAAVLLVAALAIALVLANGALKTQTAVPPLPAMPESSSTTPSRPVVPSTPRRPRPTPPPSGSGTPTETTGPASLQSVVYNVTGDGRAISITYMDTGDVMQTEFNVALPWSKEVSLAKSGVHPAIVTVINIGHNVTCSLTIAGVQVRQREGVGLTICNAPPS